MLHLYAHTNNTPPPGIQTGRTCRVGASIVPGACHVGNRGLGMLGADIKAATATGEHGPGLLINDGLDDNREYRLVITSSTFAPGTLQVYEDGSIEFTGPGTVTQTLYESSVSVGSAGLDAGFQLAPVQASFDGALESITCQVVVSASAQAQLSGALEGVTGQITVDTTVQAQFAAALESIAGTVVTGGAAQAVVAGALDGITGAVLVGAFRFSKPRGQVFMRPVLRTIGAQEIF